MLSGNPILLLFLVLFIGYLRSLFPVFGRLPNAAQWLFTELGLLLFMAGVGLRGGHGLIEILISSGLALVLTGVVVTLVPLTLAYIFGRIVQNESLDAAGYHHRRHDKRRCADRHILTG